MIDLDPLGGRLRTVALGYPDAVEEFPWGQRVVKVRKKIFLFLSNWEGGLSLGVKLPASHEFALMFDCCTPSRYGLGKSGWVTCHLLPDTVFDCDLLPGWIDESYRAIAPKTLVKGLGPPGES